MQTIHLQGIGRIEAKPAQEFKAGEFFCWNYGGTCEIIGIKRETPATLTFAVKYKNYSGTTEEAVRTLKKTRLVGIGHSLHR